MAALVQAALESVCVAIAGRSAGGTGDRGTAQLPAAGMPHRVLFLHGVEVFVAAAVPAGGAAERCGGAAATERVYNLVLLRLNEDPPAEFAPLESWPRLIHRVLRSGRTAFLGPRLARTGTWGFRRRNCRCWACSCWKSWKPRPWRPRRARPKPPRRSLPRRMRKVPRCRETSNRRPTVRERRRAGEGALGPGARADEEEGTRGASPVCQGNEAGRRLEGAGRCTLEASGDRGPRRAGEVRAIGRPRVRRDRRSK